MEREIELALEVLRRGGIILYPTDTVWGIGCDATCQEAVERIYKLKRSEDKHSMLVLCSDYSRHTVPHQRSTQIKPQIFVTNSTLRLDCCLMCRV